MFTKWRTWCRAWRKHFQGGFSFLSLHLWSKYTSGYLTSEEEICWRMLEWKEMGFKVLKVTMSPRYIWKTRNRSARSKNLFRWTPYGLGRKVSCRHSTVVHFEFCKKKRSQDVWFKINFNISQFARDRKLLLSHNKAHRFQVLSPVSLEIWFWAGGVFAELTSIYWCVEVSEPRT